MSCQGIKKESYIVIVKVPEPFRTRVKNGITSCKIRIKDFMAAICTGFLITIVLIFAVILVGGFLGLVYVLPVVLESCYKPPDIELQGVTITNMTVYQNTTAAPNLQWELNTDLSVNLTMKNPNTVAGCSIKFRRMVVRATYGGNNIVQSVVPLDFSEKPKKTRDLYSEVKGDHVQLNQTSGPSLQGIIEKNSTLDLVVFVDTRFTKSSKQADWNHMKCRVLVDLSSPSRSEAMVFKDCNY